MVQQLLKRYSHLNWALLDQAMVSGVNFCTNILIARYLGIEEFGRFSLAWIVVLFFNSLQLAAIISPMMSIGPKQDVESAPSYFGALLGQQLLWAGGSFVLLFIGVRGSHLFFPDWRIQSLALPLAAALFAVQIQDFLRRYFFVRNRPDRAFLNDLVSYVGQLLILVTLFQFCHLHSSRVLWIIAGTSALAIVIGLFFLNSVRFSLIQLKNVSIQHWHFAKWVLAAALMHWTSGNFFFLVAGYLLGPTAIGAIRAAQNAMGVMNILLQAMENFVPSRASQAFLHHGIEGLRQYLKRVAFWGGGIAAIIGAVAAFGATFWLCFLYGDEYTSYSYVLQWFSIIYLLNFFSFPISSGLRAIEKTRGIFQALLIITIFSLLSAFPLILWLDVLGVIIGTLAVKICLIILLLHDFNKISLKYAVKIEHEYDTQ